MKFKGISEVIATLLMLIITIALAGTAYLYISGFFKSKTSIVLSIDEGFSYCNSSYVTVGVRNDGTVAARNIRVVVYAPDGTQEGTGTISLITAGNVNTTSISKTSGAGYYKVVASVSGSTAEGVVFCPQ